MQPPLDINKSRHIDFALVKVLKNDNFVRALYDILEKRNKNISHNFIPSFSEHKDFVLNHPYRVWYLIEFENEFIGNVYLLRNNCVGITVLKNSKEIIPLVIKEILKKHKPLKAIKSVRSSTFDFNVSPDNHEYISALESMGAKVAQLTFCFTC